MRAVQACAWNNVAAEKGLERWRPVCEAEDWDLSETQLEGCMLVFGASWYFTRFIFYCGVSVMRLLDLSTDFTTELEAILEQDPIECDSLELSVEMLRLIKNKAMLLVLVNYLRGHLDQSAMERALTDIAHMVVVTMLRLYGVDHDEDGDMLVLSMGNFAGNEMNFGSDLDLVFLTHGEVDLATGPIKKINRFLRAIARHEPSGFLYDIDTRLRPYGNSGTLVTSDEQFINFHRSSQEVWESQMMTRCRPIYGQQGQIDRFMASLWSVVYRTYSKSELASKVYDMRMYIEKELGSPKGKYEIKRGCGGLMDIHFITHYIQLLHGHKEELLRTGSTRDALRFGEQLQLLDPRDVVELTQIYDYLKRIESVLRLFDLKSVSEFAHDSQILVPLARAMGHDQKRDAEQAFLAEYHKNTTRVRELFNNILAER